MEVPGPAQTEGAQPDIAEDLITMHMPAYALAIRLVGSQDDAEDIVQQAYLQACSSLRRGPPPQNACTWFLKVVVNEIKCHLRGSKRRARRMAAMRTMGGKDAEEAVSQFVEQGELVSALRSAVDNLDPESRALVSLCYEYGYSQRYAAEIMDVPLSTLSDRLGRILDGLRASLRQAGFTTAPAVILSTLAYTSPPVPPGLKAKVGSLLTGAPAGNGSGLATAEVATKGGLAMKVVAGIAAVGALAAGIAAFDLTGRRSESRSSPAAAADMNSAQGAPTWEHLAFSSDIDFLDGPGQEALGAGRGAIPAIDGEGNVYLMYKYSTSRIRCVRADGQVETIAGDDRWPGNFRLAEGPAAFFLNRSSGPRAGEYTVPGDVLTVYGLPLKGEEHGRIYFHWAGESPYKIFRNKDKGGRWWFRRLGAPGKAKPPTTAGQTVKLDEVDLTGAKIRAGMVAWQGNVYTFDEPKGEMTCSFTLADYEPKVLECLGRANKPVGEPEHYVRTGDGSVYLLYMWRTYPGGEVFRMSPDRKQFEHIISDNTQRLKGQGVRANRDGPGLATTWHCGPGNISFSGNVLFTHAIDSPLIRRWVAGRMSTLCYDGEWRETPDKGAVRGDLYQIGPPGSNCIYFTQYWDWWGLYRFGPVDIAKPTVGPLQEIDAKKEGDRK